MRGGDGGGVEVELRVRGGKLEEVCGEVVEGRMRRVGE